MKSIHRFNGRTLFYAYSGFGANYLHENNSLACSYKRFKGYLSAAYLLSLMSVKGIDKNLPPSFLSLY